MELALQNRNNLEIRLISLYIVHFGTIKFRTKKTSTPRFTMKGIYETVQLRIG